MMKQKQSSLNKEELKDKSEKKQIDFFNQLLKKNTNDVIYL